MCGRARIPGETQFIGTYDFSLDIGAEWKEHYNFAPTQHLPIVRVNREAGDRPEVAFMRWGLIPFFAKGVAGKYSTINARVESIDTTASYRGPWKRGQRCIFTAGGFYEWHLTDSGAKQPYYIHLNDQESFGMASLWDRSTRADGTVIESCSIITLEANTLMAEIHNSNRRMPAILRRQDHMQWLTGTVDEAKAVIRQYPSESMIAWPVSTRVNSARNDGPELVEPIALPD